MEIKTADPLKILETTSYVVDNSQNVVLNPDKLEEVSEKINKKIQEGLGESTSKNDPYFIFLEDAVNFCFWAEKNKPKWEVEWPAGVVVRGGGFGLRACFQRAVSQQSEKLKPETLAEISFEEVRKLFRSSNGGDIPLLEKRWENLKEAGQVLVDKFGGNFSNVLDGADGDAVQLVKIIYENFSSFRDISQYQGREVYLLKRAQICAYDLSLNMENGLRNVGQLTAFADYKLPQMLRKFGVISYAPELANKIDSYVLLPAGSGEEVEIRANTIWAVELIRQRLQKYPAVQIDNALWLLSQDQSNVMPYHRTYTIYY